jgi:hypothetical protein
MKTFFKLLSLSLVILFSVSCESKDPAVLKVFVRSSSNQLMDGAKVIVIGDQQSNPATLPFVDTVFSNASGFAVVDMDQYFNVSGADNTTGYFDIIVKYNNKIANDYARCRVHTTTVKTIYLPN